MDIRWVAVNPSPEMNKLVLALRSAVARGGILDKQQSQNHEILDAFQLPLLQHYHEEVRQL